MCADLRRSAADDALILSSNNGIGRIRDREVIVTLRKRWAETRDAFRDEIKMTA